MAAIKDLRDVCTSVLALLLFFTRNVPDPFAFVMLDGIFFDVARVRILTPLGRVLDVVYARI